MNISSVVIRTRPEHLASVAEELVAQQLGEVHFSDDSGRLVVTIEGDTVGEEKSKLQAIQNLPNVLTADLSYAYSDEGIELPEGPPAEDTESVAEGDGSTAAP